MIKKGYMVQVTSWENDADYYNTITQTGLPLEEVKVLCVVFDWYKGRYEDRDLVGLVLKLNKIPNAWVMLVGQDVDEEDKESVLDELMYEWVGVVYECGEVRNLERYKIYKIDQDIAEELL